MPETTEPTTLEAAAAPAPQAAGEASPTTATPPGAAAQAAEPDAPASEHARAESLSIDEVLKEAESLLKGPAGAAPSHAGDDAAVPADDAADAGATPDAPPAAEPIDVQDAPRKEKPSSVDELQSAIDEALKEAEGRRAAQVAGAHAAPAPAPTVESHTPEPVPAPAPAESEHPVETAAPAEPGTPTATAEPISTPSPAGVVGATAPAKTAPATEDESDEEFAAPEAVMAQAAAGAEGTSPDAATPGPVSSLDAELAAKGKAALAAEDEEAGPVQTAAVPVAAAGTPVAAPPPPSPSGKPATAEAKPSPQTVASSQPASVSEERAGVVAVAKNFAGRSAQGVAARYLSIGEGPRKIIRWSACGTLVQAAILWGWLMFVRSPHLPQAQEGSVHPVSVEGGQAAPKAEASGGAESHEH